MSELINNIFHQDIKSGWMDIFIEFHKLYPNYFNDIEILLKNIKYYPNKENIFECFKHFDIQETKCVFLGQDPYINEINYKGIIIPQAMGLSFSVPEQYKVLPPSLKNIFKELKSDLKCNLPKTGDLINWVNNKVLLLNVALTVQAGKSGSHIKMWEKFTNYIIQKISEKCSNVVFILLGNFAKTKKKFIDTKKHCVIEGVHPSPLSAHNGFFGSKIFSKTNEYLAQNNIEKINWII
jgi:uracil-DNA glycosylase